MEKITGDEHLHQPWQHSTDSFKGTMPTNSYKETTTYQNDENMPNNYERTLAGAGRETVFSEAGENAKSWRL